MKKLIHNICIKNKDKIAYSEKDKIITYDELWEKSHNLACYLSNKDYKRILIIGNNELEEYILIVACLIASITYIPINYDIPKDRLKKIINESKCDLIINIKNYDINIKHNYNKINQSKNEIAYIIFTSGSTGIPKGVPISYKNLFNFIKWLNNKSGLKIIGQNVLNTANFSFDLSVADIFYSLSNGLSLYTIRDKNPKVIISYIKEKNINYIFATPTYIKLCMIDENFNSIYINKLNYIFFCGETLEANTVKKILNRFNDIKIINAYGPTECTCAVTSILIKKDMLENSLPIGDIESAACNIYLENDEIIIEGESVFSGYLNTQNTIKKYYTKDIGKIIDKKLYFIGRKDNQIKIAGYRIEIEEIENVIKKIYNIDEVIIVPIKNNNRIVKLKCLTKEKIDLNKLKLYLPEYMIPNDIEIVDKFIYTNNNKLDRKAINEKYSC